MNRRVCFIGHRRIGDSGLRERLKNEIENKIKSGCNNFTMGAHGDFDEMALSVCRELRQIFPYIEIEVVITSYNKLKKRIEKDEIWGTETYTPYEDVKTVMYDIEETYFKRRIIESNHQMIDACTELICYVDPNATVSGAKYAYNYAKKKGLKITNLF